MLGTEEDFERFFKNRDYKAYSTARAIVPLYSELELPGDELIYPEGSFIIEPLFSIRQLNYPSAERIVAGKYSEEEMERLREGAEKYGRMSPIELPKNLDAALLSRILKSPISPNLRKI